MDHPFKTRYDDLPDSLPVFPLAGVLLLPGGVLPLNIFEQRYINMTLDALGSNRLIGMIQSQPSLTNEDHPALYTVGCAGRITSFMEGGDGARLLISLTGVTRFRVKEEISSDRGYRRIIADWRPYRDDFNENPNPPIERENLRAALEQYFALQKLSVDWQAIEKMESTTLINFLSMNLPFEPEDRQALLEASDTPDRARLIAALAELYTAEPAGKVKSGTTRH